MADYSGTALARKLGIRKGHRVLLLGTPRGLAESLEPVPEAVSLLGRAGKPVDVVLCFARRQTDLGNRLPSAMRLLKPEGGLWVGWPKRSSGVATDLDFATVQRIGLETGLVDNKVCAIDETWSALRFIYRLEDR